MRIACTPPDKWRGGVGSVPVFVCDAALGGFFIRAEDLIPIVLCRRLLIDQSTDFKFASLFHVIETAG